MSSDAVKRWLIAAPPVALLTVCLTAVGGLASWVWVVSAEVKDQKAVAAVAAAQASGAAEHADRVESNATARIADHERGVEARLSRIEDKLDKLIEQTAYMRSRLREEKKP